MDKHIKTTDDKWLEKALRCYRDGIGFKLIDDAEIGIGQKDLESGISLVRAASRRKISLKQIGQMLTGLGIGAAGIWMVIAAIVDPEPTSKLGLLIAGGIVLTLTGGLAVLRALGQRWTIKGKPGGVFEVEPGKDS
ncbi:hypothetical protein GF359_08120 [candidate division WOR-3 bacterium]|uniref:Uncharacterized protein n=1 Tax=candidate division WOR-3 bacterium TaxID=2052148 RepID=A0A9D5KCL5_UNCW3|nr:hypothetical protein [candidate division WOR-3 bacterium]MBD3365166.1 hypothetical protein [candidate division WOR-3 bacterium]